MIEHFLLSLLVNYCNRISFETVLITKLNPCPLLASRGLP
jgi:hypothetical protein